MNIVRSRVTAVMTLVLSVLALYASTAGVLDNTLYQEIVATGIISEALLVGSVAQDLVSIPLAIVLGVVSILFLLKPGYKSFISVLGLAWYFFYAYGLYVMQGQYTSIYIIYLAIFSLSIYSLIWGLISFKQEDVRYCSLPNSIRNSVGAFLMLILFVLCPAWVIRMSLDVAKHIPGETYAVFILDLGIVFPALGQIAFMLFKKKAFGYVLAGVALLKAFTLCLSWAFAQWYGAIKGAIPFDFGMTAIATTLTIISLLLFIPYILKLNGPVQKVQQRSAANEKAI